MNRNLVSIGVHQQIWNYCFFIYLSSSMMHYVEEFCFSRFSCTLLILLMSLTLLILGNISIISKDRKIVPFRNLFLIKLSIISNKWLLFLILISIDPVKCAHKFLINRNICYRSVYILMPRIGVPVLWVLYKVVYFSRIFILGNDIIHPM